MRTIALALACIATLQAGTPETIRWDEAPQAFSNRTVLVQLTNGVHIEGRWLSVTSDAFRFEVEKTSKRRLVGRGVQTLPRSSILRVKIRENRIRGRVIGTTAGVYAGSTLPRVASHSYDEGVAFGAVLAGAFAGYFVGRAWDYDTREVVLLP